MNEIQTKEVRTELHRVLENMDIPKMRFDDLGWLTRNIGINNSNHPNFILATWLIEKLKESKNEQVSSM
jgi:hypothetical protein